MNTRWNHRIVILFVAIILSAGAVLAKTQSQDSVWDQVDKLSLQQPGIASPALPAAYETFRLNKAALQTLLSRAPEEYSGSGDVILSLPMPDGSFSRFVIEHSLVVERGLLTKYPQLGATYRGHGIDDPTATARFDFLPSGFHSMILSNTGTIIVDPYSSGDTENYISYFKHDKPLDATFKCDVGSGGFDAVTKPSKVEPSDFIRSDGSPSAPEVTSGTQLRTYRLALAADNEYCVAVGGNTIAGSLAAEVLIMNRVNGVYEKNLAIHLNIIANNNLITFAGDNLGCPSPATACNAGNDPYTNDDGVAMLTQNQSTVDTVIGTGNYDMGHVFSTGGGGVATLNGPCNATKARGVTGLPNPIGDDFAIDFVAHEMGHQFGAQHTFNSTVDNCGGGNRSAGAAYEPGSGITIMAYAGICGNQDLAQHSIDTFHVKSLEQIVAFSQNSGGGGGGVCAATVASGNTPPTVTGPGNFNIPKLTPFSLTATATDGDAGDSITYDWQEYDLDAGGIGTAAVPNTDSDGTARAILRPYLPTVGGTRTFPTLTYILANANVPPATYNCGRGVGAPCLLGERLPAIARTMTFQVVARDNHAGAGGINTATSLVTVSGTSGPFAVTAPNTAVSFTGNTFQTITWDVSGTTGAPISAANVKISFSSDGGLTFPTVLAASTANDGTEDVLIPNTPTTTARIKVEAVGNIFFDISNTNFTVTAGGGTPTSTPTSTGTPTPTSTSTPTATATATPCGSWLAGPPVAPAGYALQGVLGSDNNFYIAGGQTSDATPILSSQVSRYDSSTNTWSTVAPMPVAISQGIIGASPGKIYVAGGFLGGTAVTNALRIYDIASNTWSSGANLPTAVGVEAAAGAVVNGKFYVMGGDDFNNALNTNFVYDIATNTWTTGAVLPDTRTNVAGTVANGLIYAYGGLTGAQFTAIDTLLRYDPVANSWTNLGSAGTTARGNYGGISPFGTGQLLITDGANTAFVATNTTHIFTISGGTFSTGPTMIRARAGHAQGTLVDGRIIVADGLDTATTTTSEVELLSGCASGTPTNTPTATATATATPTNTPSNTPTSTPTATSTPTSTPTATATNTPTSSPTNTSTTTPTNTATSTPTATATGTPSGVAVSLPDVSATPGTITVPITTGNTTGLGIISYDLQISFDPAVVQPANPAFDQVGTLSSGMSITPNPNNAGHLIISAFQSADLTGAGTLLNLRFTVVGTAGQSSPLAFADYTDPGNSFHPAFMFNEGVPSSTTTNGSVTIPGGATPTNTPTTTPTPTATASATATATATGTATATATPTATATGSPTATPVGTYANPAPICTTLGSPGSPYPSTINVVGGPVQIDGLRVTLVDVAHQLPDNMDFLLVGPTGASMILMADAGGSLPQATPGVTLTFSDSAGAVLPDSAALTSGTFEPTSWEPGQSNFPAPAPAGPYNEPGSTVGGTGTQTLMGNFGLTNSNGTWSLYMRDDAGLFTAPVAITGCVNGGWQLQFIPTTAASVGISGRVTTANGNGIRGVQMVLTGNTLATPRIVTTGSFGYYNFGDLQAGETYVVTISSKRYTFSLPSRVISLVDNITNADFTAEPQD